MQDQPITRPENSKLYIKHMVSTRCKLAVEGALLKTGLSPVTVDLGEVEISGTISGDQKSRLKILLAQWGLELIDDKRSILVERIKNTVVEMVHHSDEEETRVNFSDYLRKRLHHDYCYMSSLFSETQGTTIEQFMIAHKVERIKELIIYDELSVSQIAWKMNYSSVAHLSNQFKKVTGLSPSQFKQLKVKQRNPIEETGIVKPLSGYVVNMRQPENARVPMGA
jgi:AraC-like DNA-binding protein